MPIDPRLQAALDAPLTKGSTVDALLKTQKELFPHLAPLPGKYAARGYARPPGTGPKGETCRSCNHAYEGGMGNRNYWKCAVSACQSKTKNGDIALRSAACSQWEAKPKASTQGTGESWGA